MTDQSSPESTPTGHGTFRLGLESIRLGSPQVHRTITAFPLFLSFEAGPDYLTLDQAMATGNFRVTEVSQSGSVPSLNLVNRCGRSVLVLDGEELLGTKQNRVVNLSLLVPDGFEGPIPVSCTEQGRWRPTSEQAHASDVLMELKARRSKAESVSASLERSSSYDSDQMQVWGHIQKLQNKAAYLSATAAMHDVFVAREKEVAAALEAMPALPGQHGVLVFVGGKPAGFDLVSRSEAYAFLHAKIVRSYALDAVLEAPRESAAASLEEGHHFFRVAAACPGQSHRSVGLGETVRFRGSGVAGAALVETGFLIHAAFFGEGSADETDLLDSMRKVAEEVPAVAPPAVIPDGGFLPGRD